MKTVKILHCSDLHFDTPFSDLNNSFSEIRREDLRETFGNILSMANKEKVDILLISGDLFDNLRVMKTTLDYIRKKLEEIKHIKVFIAPGNHDPNNEKSFYNMINWPSNVHIFSNDMECIFLEDLNAFIYGRAFSKPYEKESLLKDFSAKFKVDKSFINIMVLHGDIAVQESGNEYNPITEEDMGNTSMDYIALGHRHSFSGINRTKGTYYAYCGNPEGRGFDETGDKGIIIGEVGSSYVDLNFIPLCKRKYISLEVDITSAETYEDIMSIIISNLEDEEKEKNLYKIILKGEVSPDFIINKPVLEEKLKSYFYYIKILDKTTVEIDYEALSKEISLKGIFAKKMLQRILEAEGEKEKQKLQRALKIGIQSLSDGELILK